MAKEIHQHPPPSGDCKDCQTAFSANEAHHHRAAAVLYLLLEFAPSCIHSAAWGEADASDNKFHPGASYCPRRFGKTQYGRNLESRELIRIDSSAQIQLILLNKETKMMRA
eukprot:6174547-Pleurochrysis_carterae.AAC.1